MKPVKILNKHGEPIVEALVFPVGSFDRTTVNGMKFTEDALERAFNGGDLEKFYVDSDTEAALKVFLHTPEPAFSIRTESNHPQKEHQTVDRIAKTLKNLEDVGIKISLTEDTKLKLLTSGSQLDLQDTFFWVTVKSIFTRENLDFTKFITFDVEYVSDAPTARLLGVITKQDINGLLENMREVLRNSLVFEHVLDLRQVLQDSCIEPYKSFTDLELDKFLEENWDTDKVQHDVRLLVDRRNASLWKQHIQDSVIRYLDGLSTKQS